MIVIDFLFHLAGYHEFIVQCNYNEYFSRSEYESTESECLCFRETRMRQALWRWLSFRHLGWTPWYLSTQKRHRQGQLNHPITITMLTISRTSKIDSTVRRSPII
jgi:hypothetical protein